MKKLFISTLLLICFLKPGIAQSTTKPGILNKSFLVGRWQYSTRIVGSGFLENFEFFANGNFVYVFDPVSGNQKFTEMKGKYRVENDQLILRMTSYTIIEGGEIVTGGFGTSFDLFETYKATPKKVVLKTPVDLDPLFFSEFDKKERSVLINAKRFFKL